MKTPPPFSQESRDKAAGFSLIEVVVALGIASFCLVGMMGLLPTGISSDRSTFELTSAAGLAQAVAGDVHAIAAGTTATQTPRFGIPISGSGGGTAPSKTLYFSDDGTTFASTPAGLASPHFRVDVILGASVKSYAPRPVRVLVTWPVMAAAPAWPTNVAGSFEALTTTDVNDAPLASP